MAYPYFAATLPVQRFGEAPEWTMETFRAECAEQLSAHDNATLLALLDGGESADPYVCAWRDIETQLRNAVAPQRFTPASRRFDILPKRFTSQP